MYIRSDHLQSIINYCLEQAEISGINTLAFDDYSNQQDLTLEEQIEVLKQYKQAAADFTGHECLVTIIPKAVNDERWRQRSILLLLCAASISLSIRRATCGADQPVHKPRHSAAPIRQSRCFTTVATVGQCRVTKCSLHSNGTAPLKRSSCTN